MLEGSAGGDDRNHDLQFQEIVVKRNRKRAGNSYDMIKVPTKV